MKTPPPPEGPKGRRDEGRLPEETRVDFGPRPGIRTNWFSAGFFIFFGMLAGSFVLGLATFLVWVLMYLGGAS